jgi:hypothetical protein
VSPARDFSSRPRGTAFSLSQQALMVAGVGALAVAAWAAADARAGHRDAVGSLARVRGETEAARARIRELEGRRGPEQALALRALLSAEAPPPRVVAALAELLPGDVRLDSVALTYGEQVEIDLRVVARTPAAFDLFLESLQRSPSFTRVLPGDEDRRAQMRATVRGRYRGGAR